MPALQAGGHSHENLLESYGCGGRIVQLGEHLLCNGKVKKNQAKGDWVLRLDRQTTLASPAAPGFRRSAPQSQIPR